MLKLSKFSPTNNFWVRKGISADAKYPLKNPDVSFVCVPVHNHYGSPSSSDLNPAVSFFFFSPSLYNPSQTGNIATLGCVPIFPCSRAVTAFLTLTLQQGDTGNPTLHYQGNQVMLHTVLPRQAMKSRQCSMETGSHQVALIMKGYVSFPSLNNVTGQ